MKNIKLIALLIPLFWGCEKIEILPPPSSDVDDKTGTGDSDARSILFVQNQIPTIYLNPASEETNVVSDDPLEYLSNDQFCKPIPGNTAKLNLDVFPTLAEGVNIPLQEPIANSNLEPSNYIGAFGTTTGADWYTDSEWFTMDAQEVDYGYNPNTVEVISGRITSNTTWTKDKRYRLDGQIFVESGVTLTIEPGTVIFGSDAPGSDAGVLCFNRGSKINAVGTPDEPIVFTSTFPPGQRTRGQWGGVVFCGDAVSNKGTDIGIEGINPVEPGDGEYGGSNNADNSGQMAFVRVEFSGIAITPGNEINGITFGGVGTGTDFHHLLVSYGGDDAMEWFGGAMNSHHIVTYNTLDDDLDMDQGFSGSVQHLYLVRWPYAADESGSAMFEVSSSKTVGTTPVTNAKISNATLVGPIYQLDGTGLIWDRLFQGGMYSKDDAHVEIINSVFIGMPVGIQNP